MDTNEARPWELADAVPTPSAPRKTQGAKLLAIGRRAMGRGERLKKDGSDEELQQQQPASVPAPAVMEETKRGTPWIGKVSTLLGRKATQKSADADYWDPTPVQDDVRQDPQLYIDTQGPLIDTQGPLSPPVYRPETRDYLTSSGMRSRFSVTPDATKPSYPQHHVTPRRRHRVPSTPTVVISAPKIFTPTSASFPYPSPSGLLYPQTLACRTQTTIQCIPPRAAPNCPSLFMRASTLRERGTARRRDIRSCRPRLLRGPDRTSRRCAPR